MIAYSLNCKKCGRKGDMQSYEDELERIAVITAKKALENFGFVIEREAKKERSCRPKSKHLKDFCEACKLGICAEAKKVNKKRAPKLQDEIV